MSAPTQRKKTTKPAVKQVEVNAGDKVTVEAVAHRTYYVQEDVLHYTTRNGIELEIDLDFPADLLKAAMGGEDTDEETQFDAMKRAFGDNFVSAYDDMGVLERRRLQRAVFSEFQKAMLMPMGESSRSSHS